NCALPILLLPSHHRASRLPLIQPHPLQHLDTVHLPLPSLSKRGASPELTFLSNPMERFDARLTRNCSHMSSAEKPMEACVSCMEPAFAVAAPVRCASSANGMAGLPRSRARSACFFIRLSSALRPCCGTIGVGECIGVRAGNWCG